MVKKKWIEYGTKGKTFPAISIELTVQYECGKKVQRGQKIRYKGVLCEIMRIQFVHVHELGITISCKVTPLEEGLNG